MTSIATGAATTFATLRYAVVACLRSWLKRDRDRRELMALSPHLLTDIGFCIDDVRREGRKRPWQRPTLRAGDVPTDNARRLRMLRINDKAPDFTAETTDGPITFHDWMGDGWAVLFSHPKDFTPVCTTELGTMAKLSHEFAKRHCKVMGLSADTVADHRRWMHDIEETQGSGVDFPLIGDTDLKVAKLYGMLSADAGDTSQGRTAADNATIRSTFVIGPDKKIKLMFTYPMTTGRNFAELLRVLDSMQLTAKHRLATPADWRQGEDVMIIPAVTDDEARKVFPQGWRAPKPYIRIVPQPAV